jgi:hypothetical protein
LPVSCDVAHRSALLINSSTSGYGITIVACEVLRFGPGGGIEIELDVHLLAIYTKVAFKRVAS